MSEQTIESVKGELHGQRGWAKFACVPCGRSFFVSKLENIELCKKIMGWGELLRVI